jgi:hypothetical protein
MTTTTAKTRTKYPLRGTDAWYALSDDQMKKWKRNDARKRRALPEIGTPAGRAEAAWQDLAFTLEKARWTADKNAEIAERLGAAASRVPFESPPGCQTLAQTLASAKYWAGISKRSAGRVERLEAEVREAKKAYRAIWPVGSRRAAPSARVARARLKETVAVAA